MSADYGRMCFNGTRSLDKWQNGDDDHNDGDDNGVGNRLMGEKGKHRAHTHTATAKSNENNTNHKNEMQKTDVKLRI